MAEEHAAPPRRRILRDLGLAGAGVGFAVGARGAGTPPQPAANPGGRAAVDPSYIDPQIDSRSVSFENPTGGRGTGGRAGRGRKGSPVRLLHPGQTLVLADIRGPGTLRHFWMTFDDGEPEHARALRLEVFYDGAALPSISVPVLDFFGLPHGRRTEFYSVLMGANAGRAFNSYIPMPFAHSVRVEISNGSPRPSPLYYQIDYTLEPALAEQSGYLHAAFRRENPATPGRDFVIAEGLRGPGRFLGCVVGVRVLDEGDWYGEGEVKIYRDGDQEFPTYCGTGLEDYVGSGWGLHRHFGPYSGAPLDLRRPPVGSETEPMPVFAGFYRWHLLDPVMFARELRVTIQQLGYSEFHKGQEAQFAAYKAGHAAACDGWQKAGDGDLAWLAPDDGLGMGCVERRDDYCATAFVYCREPQAVPRVDTLVAARDLGRQAFERTE